MNRRWPLGSEPDEFSESGVEPGSVGRVDLSVGFAEHGFVVGIVFDPPSVFMEEPVVVATQQDQIVQIGRSPIRPMLVVVGVNEVLVPQPGNRQPPSRYQSW